MRKIFYLSILILAVVLVSSMTTSLAQEPSARTDFQIQNFSTTDAAAITLTYYNSTDGSALPEVSDTINAGSSKNYAPIPSDHGLPDGFEGSLVVSSDQPVAAVVNLIAGDGGAFGGATYNSVSTGETTVSFPSVYNGWARIINSYFYVQNLDSTNPAEVTVTYAATNGIVDTDQDSNNSCQLTATIQPEASFKFNQADNPCLLDDPSTNAAGFFGSATVNSTNGQLLAGALIQYDGNSILANNGLTAADASTNPVAPLFLSNIFSTWSSFTLQNTGTEETEVTVTYTPSGNRGSECTQTATIQPGGSFAFGNAYTQNTEDCSGGSLNEQQNTAGFVGSARVSNNSTNQPLVGIVNQVDLPGLQTETSKTVPDRNPPSIRGANASAYNAFNPANASSRLDFPLIIKRLSFSGRATIDTGMSIANVGTTETTVTCSFAGRVRGTVVDTSNANRTATIAAGASTNITQNSAQSNLPDRFVGSATCTASDNGMIVGTINQVGGTGDLLLTSEGFQQQ